MNYFVYGIHNTFHNRIYVGISADVNKRIQEHNKGYVASTKPYRPWTLIYKEKCADRKSARAREKYWKSGYGRERLKQYLAL